MAWFTVAVSRMVPAKVGARLNSRAGWLPRPTLLRWSIPGWEQRVRPRSPVALSRSLQLPESIVDGVVTDTTICNLGRVAAACVQNGLDSQATYASLPLESEASYHDLPVQDDRRRRRELSELDAEIARLSTVEGSYQALIDRRDLLTSRLAQSDHHGYGTAPVSSHRSDHAQWQQRLTELHDRARDLRARQSELRRWIADIDRDAAARGLEHRSRVSASGYPYQPAFVNDELRRGLNDLDAQMIAWRRALSEVRGLRNVLVRREGGPFVGHGASRDHGSVLDERSFRRWQLEGFVQAMDRYDRSRPWEDLYPDSSRPWHHIEDIEQRISSAMRQIDWLLQRYTGPGATAISLVRIAAAAGLSFRQDLG